MSTVIVTVDMAFDDDEGFDQTALRIEQEFGIELEVLQAVGPAGGWPEVQLAGERANVERALRDAWDMDDTDIAHWLDA